MNWILRLWRKLFGSGAAVPPHGFKVRFDADLPDQLAPETLSVAGEAGSYWCAAMACPCGCGASIHLSLITTDKPYWRLTVDRAGRPTLYPSVWRTSGCRSHFFLRRGQVVWCESSYGPVPRT
jgi:hypothetical protein